MTMPDIPNLTQLGFGLGALALIWVVVQYFIKALDKKDTQISAIIEKKDTQISTMVASFNETINNHIVHETAQAKKQTAVLKNLNKSINLLITKVTK